MVASYAPIALCDGRDSICICGRVGFNSLDGFFSLVRLVHRPFATDGSFIACSIKGIADGVVVAWLFLSIEPTFRPSFCCFDDDAKIHRLPSTTRVIRLHT
jgi:hypothetical protein